MELKEFIFFFNEKNTHSPGAPNYAFMSVKLPALRGKYCFEIRLSLKRGLL